MELLKTELLGKPLRLEATLSGWQQLFWDGHLVSERVASVENEGDMAHEFAIQTEKEVLHCTLRFSLQWQPFLFSYKTIVNELVVEEGTRNNDDMQRTTPDLVVQEKKAVGVMGLGTLAFKLMKSVKVIKVVLASATLAAYSWLFSLPFALCLIACLVIHEYGHLKAMKYFGMKTKGIFLIPFIGGLALGDDKINTRWQDVVIAIMGPTFGLFLSIASTVTYLVTDEIFFGGLAVFNALLNLFNLLPILPLDGGHILKSITFSMSSRLGLVLCMAGAALGVFLSYTFGLALLGFMLTIGTLEILSEWRLRLHSRLLPLDRYGQVFSIIWYVLTVLGFVGVIAFFAGTGDDILGLPLKVLQS